MRTMGKGANALLYGVSVLALMSAGSQSAKAQTVLDTITVVATLTEENVWNTLAPTSTVRPDDLNRLMPSQIGDMFFSVPGVSFQRRGDDPGQSLNIRGMQDFGRVAVVVDGARQNFQRSGHQADGQFYLDPELIGGIDVVRGPTANIYGTGAIGGVVSFRTKDVEDVLKPGQRWGVLTHGMIGSNTYEGLGSVFAAARPNQNFDFILGGVYRDRDEYKDGNGNTVLNSGSEMASGLAKVTVRPADGHEIKFSMLASEGRFENGTPSPASVTVQSQRATVYSSVVDNYIANARWRYQRPEDKIFDFDANVYWTRTDLDQTKVDGSNSSLFGRLGSHRTFRLDTIGTDVHNTSRFETGPVRHALTIGGDVFKDTVETADVTGTGDLFTPSGERTVGGGFAQLKSTYGWLDVISALRYDAYDLSGGVNNVGSNGDRFSPKITVGLTPVQWFTIYGSYAEGYRAPAITEVFVLGQHPPAGPGANFNFLQNTSLQPEVGKNKEIGINLRFDNIWAANDALRVKANVFRNDVDNFIEQVTVLDGQSGVGGELCNNPPVDWGPPFGLVSGNCIQFQNVTKARIEGFELESRYDAGFWFLNASYTALKGTNEIEDKPLAKIPANTFAGTLGFRFLDRKLTTAISLLSVAPKDPRDIPHSLCTSGPCNGQMVPDLIPTAGYNIVNLYLAYQFNEDVTFNAAVENLFDTYYVPYTATSTRGSTVIPSASPGLTFKGGLRVRFGDAFYKNG
jgi:hemoglobin/transferrin/lactoferrin receptor protein